MNWFNWVLIAWFTLNALASIEMIDKERKPLERNTSVIVVFVYGLLIAGVVYFS